MPRKKKGDISVSSDAIKDIYPAAVPRNEDGSVKPEAVITADKAREIGAVTAESAQYNVSRQQKIARRAGGEKEVRWNEGDAMHLFDAIKEAYGATSITIYIQRIEPQPVYDFRPFKMTATPDPAAFYDYVMRNCHQKSTAASYLVRFKEGNGQERGRGHLHLPDTTDATATANAVSAPAAPGYPPYIPGTVPPHMMQMPWAPPGYPYPYPQPQQPAYGYPHEPPQPPPAPAASAPLAPPAPPAPPAPAPAPAPPPAVGTLSGPNYQPPPQPPGMDPVTYGMIAGALDAMRQTLEAVRQNQVQQATVLGEVQALRSVVLQQQAVTPPSPSAVVQPSAPPQPPLPQSQPMPFSMGGAHMPMMPPGVVPAGAPYGVPPVPGSYMPYPQPPPPAPAPPAVASAPAPQAAPQPEVNPLMQLQNMVKVLTGTQTAIAQIRHALGADEGAEEPPSAFSNPLAGTLSPTTTTSATTPPEDDGDLRVVPLGMGAEAPVLAYNKSDGSINMIGSLLGNVGQVPKILSAVEKMMRAAQVPGQPQLPQAIETVSEPVRPTTQAASPSMLSMIPPSMR